MASDSITSSMIDDAIAELDLAPDIEPIVRLAIDRIMDDIADQIQPSGRYGIGYLLDIVVESRKPALMAECLRFILGLDGGTQVAIASRNNVTPTEVCNLLTRLAEDLNLPYAGRNSRTRLKDARRALTSKRRVTYKPNTWLHEQIIKQ